MSDDVIHLEEQEADNFLHAINTFAINLHKCDSARDVAWSVVKDAIAQLGFKDCVLYLLTNQGLVQMAAHGSKNPVGRKLINPLRLDEGMGIVGYVLKTGKFQLVNDTSKDDRYIVDDEQRLSELAVPIIQDNKVIGVIDSEHPDKDFFSQRHVQILTTIAALTATKLEQTMGSNTSKSQAQNDVIDKRNKQLEKSMARIEEINDSLYHFTYALTHDLRQPLHSILGLTEIGILENPKSEVIQVLEKIRTVSKTSLGLVNEIMQYASLDADDLQRFSWVDMNILLKNVTDNLAHLIEKNEISLKMDELPRIFCIEHLLLQVFQNLIANAIKYRNPEIPLVVEIKYEIYDQHVFHIIDNGIGISTEYLDKVFTIFSRGSNHTDSDGFGVGLAVCKKIMQKHGGEICVSSKEGKGSTFTLKLPFYPK